MASDTIVISDDEEELNFSTSPWPSKHQKRAFPGYEISDYNDDDDVVFIEKMPCIGSRKTEKEEKKNSAVDDDCCVLSFDPDSTASVPDYPENDADDIVVVRERGPVACRDFPHARHLCVKFPFQTTLHEKYCQQCHCYVCDVRAPCLLWGQGKQINDHCHAFDKDEKWILMRQQARSPPPKLAAAANRQARARSQPRSLTQTFSAMTEKASGTDRSINLIFSKSNPLFIDEWLPVNTTACPPSTISPAVLLRPYVPSAVTASNWTATAPIPNIEVISGDRARSSNMPGLNDRQQTYHCPPASYAPIRRGVTQVSQPLSTGIQQVNPQSNRYTGPIEEPCMPAYRVTTSKTSILDKDLQTLQTFHSYLLGGITGQDQGQVMNCRPNRSLQTIATTPGNVVLPVPQEEGSAVPSQVPESNHIQQMGAVPSSVTAGEVASQNISNKTDLPGMNNPVNFETPLPSCPGNGIDGAYSLDELLATFCGDDDDLWSCVA